MRVLLASTYELGHQPLHVASPAAALRSAGHDVRCLDLAVQHFDPGLVDWAEAVALSVPMHTAMRLALRAASRIRRQAPGMPLCFYGLYAPVSRDVSVQRFGARIIAGEYEPPLLGWVAALAGGRADGGGRADAGGLVHIGRGRGHFHVPARDLLPPLERYARLVDGGGERLVGYVETTHGCAHECRHCPLPTVYGGAMRVVDADTVLADIDQLVAAGAGHITFGDPDFLNGPAHARRVVRALHERHPGVSFDCTVKVEHVLDHRHLWGELAAHGCRFVVTAVESLNDGVLRLLDKGHTPADAVTALSILRRAGIEPRPTFVPFTPWSSPADLAALVDYVAGHDLVGNVDPVQYSIRLLLPEGSLLLEQPDLLPYLGPYDAEALTYEWTPAWPETAALQQRIAALVERHVVAGEAAEATFAEIAALVAEAAGRPVTRSAQLTAGSTEGRPRLTEPWFC